MLFFCSVSHLSYPGQYRAMFVQNVRVLHGSQVRPVSGDDDPQMKYYSVICGVCQTNVGVMDSEEVYHFHHVLESQV